jgi:integrase
MGRRSYGTGSITVRRDRNGRETWYGLWMAGGRRVKRRLGVKRAPGRSDGLTRKQAEAELRRRMAEELVGVGPERRRTVEEAGAAYVEHLEHVMGRKRTTLEDYRGYLRRHLGPFFGARRLDRIRPAEVERYLREKIAAGLSPTTVVHHAAMTGLRQGELLALRWRDIDWAARRVRIADNYPRGRYDRVEATKSHLMRSVPLADRLACELDRHSTPPRGNPTTTSSSATRTPAAPTMPRDFVSDSTPRSRAPA